MNREFEILNRKLDLIYEELMLFESAYRHNKADEKTKELEYKAESAQGELEYAKSENKFINERIEERARFFRNVEEIFSRENTGFQQTER
jgi:hypothetical protein